MDGWIDGWMDGWVDGSSQAFTAGERGAPLTMWISAFNVRQLHTQVLALLVAWATTHVASLQEVAVVGGQAGRLHCMCVLYGV